MSEGIRTGDLRPTEALLPSVRYAVELARAEAATRAAQEELRGAVERMRFIAEASRVLASSLDVDTTMQSVAQLSVPRLGDFCVIYLADPGGARPVAAAHADPAKTHLVHEFERRYRPTLDHSTSAVMAAVRTGRTQRFERVPDEQLASIARDAEDLRALRALAPAAAMFVPLVARGAVLGAVSFVRSSAPDVAAYDDRDAELAEDLAQRAATALDNARLFALATDARRRAEEAAARTERLQRLTAALAGAATEREVAALVMAHGVLSTGAYAGVIAEPTADGSEIELLTCVGYPPEACMHVGRRWPVDARIPLAEAARTARGVFVESPSAWRTRYHRGYAPTATPPSAPPSAPPNASPNSQPNAPSASRAWAALPLQGDAGVRGALLWTFDAPREFRAEDRAFMAAVAQQCAQALERARLREAERRARAEAEEANRAKAEFLARMSHDLRTPLNAIGGYAQLIELGVHGPVTAPQAEALARIRRAQQHLLTLINEILSFAKLEAGQVRLHVEDVSLADVLDRLRPIVEPDVTAKGLRLELAAGDDVRVRADRDRLLQVLLNLVTNAVKFTDAGGLVAVSADASPETVAIRVRDSGRGIPADRIEAIFRPFVQSGTAADEERQGVGLGLAIGRELTRLMGGELSAESVMGEGSTFTVTLQRAEHAERAA